MGNNQSRRALPSNHSTDKVKYQVKGSALPWSFPGDRGQKSGQVKEFQITEWFLTLMCSDCRLSFVMTVVLFWNCRRLVLSLILDNI